MKTQIIKTSDRIIVKVSAELTDPARAVRRAEKKLGVKLVSISYQVHPLLILSDRSTWDIRQRRQQRWSFRLSQTARRLQSKAGKHARGFVVIDNPGGWTEACKASPRARLAARYALNPHRCMVAAVTPKLP